MKKIVVALIVTLLCVPALAQQQVPIQKTPAAAAEAVKAQPDKAVVSQGVISNTATVTVPASTEPQTVTIDTKPLVEQLMQNFVMPALGAIIVALGTFATAKINSWSKAHGLEQVLKIDDSRRDALIASVRGVAAGAIAQGMVKVGPNLKIDVPSSLLSQMAKEVVEQRAPDAVAHFGLSEADVEKRVLEQIALILPAGSAQNPA